MSLRWTPLLLLVGLLLAPAPPAAEIVRFKTQEIDTGLKVGYSVTLVDVDGDGKKDIVVVDTTRVVWFQNPTWKQRVILEGGTKPDNVSLAPSDIDGDGRLDFALASFWNPGNTKDSGILQWLQRGKTLDDPWTVHLIDTEPTIHRIRFADLDGDGKPELISVPLLGRGSTPQANHLDGAAVRITAYRIPKDPVKDRWTPEVIDAGLHVVHNFWPLPAASGKGSDVLTASYEGVSLLSHAHGKWSRRPLGAGNQANPKGKRGSSEIKQGTLKNGKKFLATIEPWHGDQVVVYTEPATAGALWERHVLDDELRWGHAVSCADLDGDGNDELIIGVRDDPNPTEAVKGRRGVRVYQTRDGAGKTWARQIVEAGGVAVEDLSVADLNGDGRPDLVAVGRQTHNVRIYWNEGK